MKFSDMQGKTYRVISAAPWEILLEEEVGIPGGEKILIRGVDDNSSFGSNLDVRRLIEEPVKS